MNKVIIFGGTTEGRRLAQDLAEHDVVSIYCVATEYGKEPIEESSCIHIHSGRMDSNEMLKLYQCERPDAIIDATHPFAEVVKGEITNSLRNYETVPFYRLSREEDTVDVSNCVFFDSAVDCARALLNTEGKVFLTTGSKELPIFCQEESLRDRIIARILPNDESLEICKSCGLKGNQIVALQGPFSKMMNIAFMREYEANIMVLKESGKAGGEAARIEAANACGAKCFVIRRPKEAPGTYSFAEVEDRLYSQFDIKERFTKVDDLHSAADKIKEKITPDIKFNVSLAGFGMGPATLTKEVQELIDDADYIFGAPRMVVGIDTNAKKYPYYLAKDIIPTIQSLSAEISYGIKNIVVLFSGDTGFYSGASKLKAALMELEYCKVKILPGISTVSALAARANETWQEGSLVSTHGVEEAIWMPKLIQSVLHNEKTFALTSGSKDVRKIGQILIGLQENNTCDFRIFVGTNLYSAEKLEWLTPEKCWNFERDGLCSLLIKNTKFAPKQLSPGMKDEEFIRDKVPMSKEEIRALSICKLLPTKDSIIYDIGSGSGSVAVELASLDSSVKVFAVELKNEACNLIQKNIDRFMLKNVAVIEGTAPDCLEGLPVPTHVFIGGSAGRLEDILLKLKAYNSQMRIVINAVTLETIAEINAVIKKLGIENEDIIQVAVSKAKKAGDYSLMQGQNPVYIVTINI